MVGWYHRVNGPEFEQTLGDSERQGNLVCCSPWGHRVRCGLATKQQQPCAHWLGVPGRQWIMCQRTLKPLHPYPWLRQSEFVLPQPMRRILCKAPKCEWCCWGYCERVSKWDDVFRCTQRVQRVVTQRLANYSFPLGPELHSAKHSHIFKHVDYWFKSSAFCWHLTSWNHNCREFQFIVINKLGYKIRDNERSETEYTLLG